MSLPKHGLSQLTSKVIVRKKTKGHKQDTHNHLRYIILFKMIFSLSNNCIICEH